MEIIRRKISRGDLLGDRTQSTKPNINPIPLITNGINQYPCTDSDLIFDKCLVIMDGIYVPNDSKWEEHLDSVIVELYSGMISKVFNDEFEYGKDSWDFSGSFTVEGTWNYLYPFVESEGDNSIMVEVTNTTVSQGFLYAKTKETYPINVGQNYRISTQISSNVLSHQNMVLIPGVTQTGYLRLFGYNPVTTSYVFGDFNEEEVEVFSNRGVVSTSFTAPDSGEYMFGVSVYISNAFGTPVQVGDFIILDDFGVLVETSPIDNYSVENIKRGVYGFFKSFNIEPTEYNLRLYRTNINNYLISQFNIDVDSVGLGEYGNQEIDDNGIQTGGYLLNNPPSGVIPFYYLGYHLYGSIEQTDDGDVLFNDGYLYCYGGDVGVWDGTINTYHTGDVVRDVSGTLWYCNHTIGVTCNDCSPEDGCAWVKCLNVSSSRESKLNLSFPLYQDIKDIGVYRDLIHPGIGEECSGSMKELTKDYKCPVPSYISDGGEVIFFDYDIDSDVVVERPCCEDYSEYGFVWWENKCYRDYGSVNQGLGKELFNLPYDLFYYNTSDNGTDYYGGPNLLPNEAYVDSGSFGEVIGDSGKRVLLYTPLIENLIDGETYIIKSKIVMGEYENTTLSNIMWGATSTLDDNWGYVYFENFETGSMLNFFPPFPCKNPGGGDSFVDVSINNGEYEVKTSSCNGIAVGVPVSLAQGIEYRVSFRYKALLVPSIVQPLTNGLDLTFSLMDPNNNVVSGSPDGVSVGYINDYSFTFVSLANGVYNMEFLLSNPNDPNGSLCTSLGTPCIGPEQPTFGFGLEYLLVEETPLYYTSDENAVVTPTKYWTSNSYNPSDGVVEVELESEVRLDGVNQVSLRLICDVREVITNDPLKFNLIVTDISFKNDQKPNFLGCEKTHFLNVLDNIYGGIQKTSVPYVTTVSSSNSQLTVLSGPGENADCDEVSDVIGWYCDMGRENATTPVDVFDGCVGTDVAIPGVTLYSSIEECLNNTFCLDVVGCRDSNGINFNPQATKPCWDNHYNDCCILEVEGCVHIESTTYIPNSTIDMGEGFCHFLQGCPDPTAGNYCVPGVGLGGNIVNCTDCFGNAPSFLYGNPLYPNAIIPGTFGDNSCCYFDPASNLTVGCMDIYAVNYDATAQIDDGSCTYATTYTMYCCFAPQPGSTCQDFSTTNPNTYNQFVNDVRCETTFNVCTTNNNYCVF